MKHLINILSQPQRYLSHLVFVSASCLSVSAIADADINASDAAKLMHEKYTSIQPVLEHNQFNQPLLLESSEADHRLKGDIYAVVDYPLTAVSTGLNNPNHWCDIMHLHINTKYCHASKISAAESGNASATEQASTVANHQPSASMRVYIGKKTPEELAQASRVDFKYTQVLNTPEYMQIMLNADQGPLGTNDYKIILEAIPLSKSKSLLHLTYSYASSLSGRIAMQTYLATVGNGKIGFTVTGKNADGQPVYISGVRGLMERNTMRYYLAIDSYLSSATASSGAQLDKRLQSWFAATEKYAQQLHEVDQNDYVEMKHAEYQRQQTMQ